MPRYPTWRQPGFLKSGAAIFAPHPALVFDPEAEAARRFPSLSVTADP